jgi:poly(3-hydroxybutyrate) depolymerase
MISSSKVVRYLIAMILIMQLVLGGSVFAQLDSIFDQNLWRKYIVHLPSGYDPNAQYPLVVNLHGLNADAAQQQSYSQFDDVADTEH